MEYQHLVHPFEPLYNENSKILILGSFPSVKSRENDFYYGHKQNRFWKVLAAVLGAQTPIEIEEKKALLLDNGIAIWDVIYSCDIVGSSDSSIRNVVPTDIGRILINSDIDRIYTNGAKAGELYRRHQLPATGMEAIVLPSTSPANAAWTMERLTDAWQSIL